MATKEPPFDIPPQMRDFADKSMDHARKAFDDYLKTTREAFLGLEDTGGDVQKAAREAQERVLAYAEENVAATFDFARQMINVASPADLVEIQRNFIESQAKALADQSRDMAEMGQEALKKMTKPK